MQLIMDTICLEQSACEPFVSSVKLLVEKWFGEVQRKDCTSPARAFAVTVPAVRLAATIA